MSAPVKLVCKQCGTDKGLWREVLVPGWEGIEATLADNGRIEESTTGDHDTESWCDAEPGHGYGCSECDATSVRLEDITRPIFIVGQRVFLPSGGTGYVDAVDGNQITVDGEEFPGGLLEPWEPHPGQLAIEAA